MHQLNALHLQYPFAGSRMLRDLLRLHGVHVGGKYQDQHGIAANVLSMLEFMSQLFFGMHFIHVAGHKNPGVEAQVDRPFPAAALSPLRGKGDPRLPFENRRWRQVPATCQSGLRPWGDHTGSFDGHLRLPCFSTVALPFRVAPCDDKNNNAILS
jgi:hypothetical protein